MKEIDEAVLISVKLSKAGYGMADKILELDSETVLTMLDYEKFRGEFESEFLEINRPNK